MSDLKKIKDEFLLKLKSKLDISEINQIKNDLFGKDGLISSQFKKIGTISDESIHTPVSILNALKSSGLEITPSLS